jgi:uncharacterized integral membrane protein
VFALAGLLVVIFAFLNWDIFELHLVFGKIEVPVTIIILVSMFGGYGYARLFSYVKSRQKDKEISYLKGELAALKHKEAERKTIEAKTTKSAESDGLKET